MGHRGVLHEHAQCVCWYAFSNVRCIWVTESLADRTSRWKPPGVHATLWAFLVSPRGRSSTWDRSDGCIPRCCVRDRLQRSCVFLGEYIVVCFWHMRTSELLPSKWRPQFEGRATRTGGLQDRQHQYLGAATPLSDSSFTRITDRRRHQRQLTGHRKAGNNITTAVHSLRQPRHPRPRPGKVGPAALA